jgi:hypothetical protein
MFPAFKDLTTVLRQENFTTQYSTTPLKYEKCNEKN